MLVQLPQLRIDQIQNRQGIGGVQQNFLQQVNIQYQAIKVKTLDSQDRLKETQESQQGIDYIRKKFNEDLIFKGEGNIIGPQNGYFQNQRLPNQNYNH